MAVRRRADLQSGGVAALARIGQRGDVSLKVIVVTVVVTVGLLGLAAGAFAALAASRSDATPSRIRWAALGDSYSAGVGGTGIFNGLLSSVGLSCSQDDSSYAVQAKGYIRARVDRFDFVACGGATTPDIYNKQLSYVHADTNVVTLTAGGNDVGFAKVAAACLAGGSCPQWFQGDDQQPTVEPWQANDGGATGWDKLFGRLVGLYEQTRRNMAADGDLYVMTYPLPFGNPDRMKESTMFFGSRACSALSRTDVDGANRFTQRLGDTIFQAVQAANGRLEHTGLAGQIHMVDWRNGVRGYVSSLGRGSVWNPNGLCGDPGAEWWINPVHTMYPNLLHPNQTGYWAGAQRLLDAMGVDARPPIPLETIPTYPTAATFPTLDTRAAAPATTPPASSPPATSPPATSPPATSPPATSPPATSPPATSPPTTRRPARVDAGVCAREVTFMGLTLAPPTAEDAGGQLGGTRIAVTFAKKSAGAAADDAPNDIYVIDGHCEAEFLFRVARGQTKEAALTPGQYVIVADAGVNREPGWFPVNSERNDIDLG